MVFCKDYRGHFFPLLFEIGSQVGCTGLELNHVSESGLKFLILLPTHPKC